MPTIQEQFDLSGKTALITGGTGWLGTAFSQAMAEVGASVVIGSRDVERAQAAAAKLPKSGGATHHGVGLDQMEPQSLNQGFKDAVAAAGKIDILVNNGLAGCPNDLADTTFEQFARQQVNNAGYFELARLLRNHVVERKAPASIVMVGSIYGVVASYPDTNEGVSVASPVAYHALKSGTIHMTRHLAVYWAKDNVRVNCLSPGPFPMDGGIPAEMEQRLCEKDPMKRMGRPHELKGALILLVSEAGSYMTGQNILVDGGWTVW